MIDYDDYKIYLERIGFAGNSLNTYPSYISQNKLDIFNDIESYAGLSDDDKLIKFSNEDSSFKEIFDNNHTFKSPDTFSDLRSGARRYKHYLQYKAIIKSMQEYDTNPSNFDINGAFIYFSVFNNKRYPVKAICKKNINILELQEDFRTNGGKNILKKIFNMQGKNNIQFFDINDEVLDEIYNPIIKENSLNQILYGPPGTGKTYNTINKAIEIIENRVLTKEELKDRQTLIDKFEKYKNDGQIEFITFHQSYGYEEFIEGIKAIPVGEEGNENGNEMIYKVVDGIFKSLVNECTSKDEIQENNLLNYENSTIWKMSLGDSLSGEDKAYFEEAVNTDTIIMGYGGEIDYSKCPDKKSIEQLNKKDTSASMIHRFKNELKNNDILIISDGNRKFKAIVQVIGDYFYDENSDFKHKRKVKWLKKFTTSRSYNEISDRYFTQVTLNRPQGVNKEKLLNYLSKTTIIDNSTKNYILIIDEINRGNLSKIFGELMTLIEETKRAGASEAIETILPYSGEFFSIPNNLYILGTMNTADRSIALMDTALRRRFKFIEMMPNLDIIKDIMVEKISIYKLLEIINKRIEYLYDRDHTIGHAYFIDLKEEGKDNLITLSNIFQNQIIPLLQEYFYDDWEKIRLVLGDNQKDDENIQFVKIKQGYNLKVLFGDKNLDSLDIDEESNVYSINEVAFNNQESYIKIYEK